jgi:transposase
MRIKTYSSDLPAASWQVIKKIIQVLRRRKWDLKEVVNAVLYVTKNGCVWRDVPGEFPPWQTVYYYFSKWVKDGTWKSINY